MSKTITLLTLFLLSAASLFSQVGYYKTYDDFKKGRLTKMEKLSMISSMGSVVFKNGKEKHRMEKEDWGYNLDGRVFRKVEDYGGFAAVVYACDDAIIYGNGYAFSMMHFTGRDQASYSTGFAYYISLNMESPVVPIFNMGYPCTSFFKKFKEENPQFKAFYDCLPADGERYDDNTFQLCMDLVNLHPSKED